MTFQTIVETMAGHDLNHLQQLETIAARIAPEWQGLIVFRFPLIVPRRWRKTQPRQPMSKG